MLGLSASALLRSLCSLRLFFATILLAKLIVEFLAHCIISMIVTKQSTTATKAISVRAISPAILVIYLASHKLVLPQVTQKRLVRVTWENKKHGQQAHHVLHMCCALNYIRQDHGEVAHAAASTAVLAVVGKASGFSSSARHLPQRLLSFPNLNHPSEARVAQRLCVSRELATLLSQRSQRNQG
jgi:hypothetical protein